MSHYVYPDTTSPDSDWRDNAVCRADKDAMHPDNDTADIAYARAICATCTVGYDCLVDAIRTGDDQYGVRAGLRAGERRAVAKRLTDGQIEDPDVVAHAVQRVLHPATAERTLRDIWEERTYDLPGGHLGWRGDTGALSFQGHSYTPKRIAFLLHRGHDPKGIVRRTCEVVECVHPLHLADNRERWQRQQTESARPEQAEPAEAVVQGGRKLAECGTYSAYQRHVRKRELIDDACRAANTAAHARLVRTGSTKATG